MIEKRNGVFIVRGPEARPWADAIEALIEDPNHLSEDSNMILDMERQKMASKRYDRTRTEFLDLCSRFVLPETFRRDLNNFYHIEAELPAVKLAPDDETTHSVVLLRVAYGQSNFSDPMLRLSEQGLIYEDLDLLLMDSQVQRCGDFDVEYPPAFTDLKRLQRISQMYKAVLASNAAA